jgi:hypothetical protein
MHMIMEHPTAVSFIFVQTSLAFPKIQWNPHIATGHGTATYWSLWAGGQYVKKSHASRPGALAFQILSSTPLWWMGAIVDKTFIYGYMAFGYISRTKSNKYKQSSCASKKCKQWRRLSMQLQHSGLLWLHVTVDFARHCPFHGCGRTKHSADI